MGRFLLAVLVLALLVAGLGYYLGWFTISTSREGNGNSDVKVKIDRNKFTSDVQRARKDITSAVERGREKVQSK
jgi:phage protein U